MTCRDARVNGRPSDGPSFELRHLRYFVAVAEERNFGRAAERLGIAQPGLSQQIASLETLVGARLLDRSRRLFQLTVPGQVFLAEARKTLAQADAAISAVERAARGETGRISIGYVASAAYAGILTELIGSFRSAYPNVELKIIEMEMRRQLDRIAEGALDFAFIRPPAPIPRSLQTLGVLSESLAAVLPAGHPLAGEESVALESLANEAFIMLNQPADVGFHRLTIMACKVAGFDPRIEAMGSDFTTIASMVAVGLGVALAPLSTACLQLPGVVYRSLAMNEVRSEVAVAFRRNEAASAVQAFIAHCRSEAARASISSAIS